MGFGGVEEGGGGLVGGNSLALVEKHGEVAVESPLLDSAGTRTWRGIACTVPSDGDGDGVGVYPSVLVGFGDFWHRKVRTSFIIRRFSRLASILLIWKRK